MAGHKPPLTESQMKTLRDLENKQEIKGLTDKQKIMLGDLLAKKHAKPKLLKTAMDLLRDIFQEQVYGRSKELQTKYMEKGTMVEEASLSLYTKVTGKLLYKNEQTLENDYFRGTPDNCYEKVRDIKSSWDYSTFPFHDNEVKNKAYEYQLQVYMDLTGLDFSELIYCLVDTPNVIIDDEIRRLGWNVGVTTPDSLPPELVVEKVQNMIYTEDGLKDYCHQSTWVQIEWFDSFKEVRPENRIKIFETQRDPVILKNMKNRVRQAREELIKMSEDVVHSLERWQDKETLFVNQ